MPFLEVCPELIFDRPRFAYRREKLLRAGVAERLAYAVRHLPQGYKIAILEGWRPPHIQRRMYLSAWGRFKTRHPDWSDAQLRRVVNRFTAPLHGKVPPPHSTGGAMDVFLADSNGKPLEMMAPYPAHEPAGFGFSAPNLNEDSHRHRDILAEALDCAGITNYPSEYWHYSFGDQGWAYRGGHPFALYGAATPPNWEPDPRDVSDAPFEFLE